MCFRYHHRSQCSLSLASIELSNMTSFNYGDFDGLFDEDFEKVTATQLIDISTQQLDLYNLKHVSNIIMRQF